MTGEYDAGYENCIDSIVRQMEDMQFRIDSIHRENAKLRELVRDMWNEGMCECGSRGKCARCEYGYPDRMRELGVTDHD